MSLTPQWLDELRTRITLSALVGQTVRIQKAGREFRGCCPFHNEKTPSFYVNDEKGFYHCFGCGAHGDAIRWMTDQRGLPFMDAVKELAALASMEVPAADPRTAGMMARRAEQQKSLHDVMAAAQDWFVAQLASPEGARARGYLATRGFTADVMQRFGFGYAPEGRQALKAALTDYPEAMLIEAGLRISVEDDNGNKREPYDRFRGRLMLPIHDARGRVIAFGGRILDKTKTDAPKYLNSPDTPLFDKGRTLYNLHRAAPLVRQSGRLVVVEGYMDVIALANAGIGEAVAPLGTALTETQIELLWRQVETPVLCFDGDAAGQRAAMRAITRALPLLRPSHSLRIVRLPQGLDPDDLIKARGPEAMRAVLGESFSLLDTLWQAECDAAPADSPEAKAGLKARLMAHVDTIADPDIKAMYRRDLQDRFSEFAFPKRESGGFGGGAKPWTPQRPRTGGGKGGFRRDQPPTQPMDVTMAYVARAPNPFRAASIDAVVAGLVRLPDQIGPHAEMLAHLAAEDQRIGLLIDHADTPHPLETSTLGTIFGNNGLTLPSADPHRGMQFAFLCDTDAAARRELGDVIAVLAEKPQVEAALAAMRNLADLTEASWAEQQRLVKRLRDLEKRELDLKARLGQMAGANGQADEGAPFEAPNKMAE